MVRWLRRDRRGATAVEFAVVGAAFFTLLLLLLEVCWQMAVAAALESGARRASRWTVTGQAAPPGYTKATYANDLILRGAGLQLDPVSLTVTTQSYPDFASVGQAGKGRDGPGGPGEILRYSVAYDSRLLTPIAQALVPGGVIQIRFVMLAKNEPYPQT